jgi:hypothetical protein
MTVGMPADYTFTTDTWTLGGLPYKPILFFAFSETETTAMAAGSGYSVVVVHRGFYISALFTVSVLCRLACEWDKYSAAIRSACLLLIACRKCSAVSAAQGRVACVCISCVEHTLTYHVWSWAAPLHGDEHTRLRVEHPEYGTEFPARVFGLLQGRDLQVISSGLLFHCSFVTR